MRKLSLFSAALLFAGLTSGCESKKPVEKEGIVPGPEVELAPIPETPAQQQPGAGNAQTQPAGEGTSEDGKVAAPRRACTKYEPNDSIADAELITAGKHLTIAICGDELDFYKVEVPARRLLTARIAFDHSRGNLELYLSDGSRDAEGKLKVLDASTTEGYDEQEILNRPFATAKTVYLIVGGQEGAENDYTLDLQITAPVDGRDCFTGCSTIIPMTGGTTWGAAASRSDGFYIYTPAQYAYGRTDLVGLVSYAAQSVKSKFPATARDPVAISDICQSDGKTPGTDVNSPRHPTTTHVNGGDMDIAYYQTDGRSDYHIICGDGSDRNNNGVRGRHNDGYFCTTQDNVVDVPRQVWFLAKLAESPKYRVVGIDQTLVDAFTAEAKRLYDNGEIGLSQLIRITEGLGFGNAGGWAFHHHHIHVSLRR